MKRTELKRTPIRRRSPQRAAQMADHRIPTIEAMVSARRTCEIGPILEAAGIATHCTRRIEGLHERRKSGQGGSRVNPANLIPACNWCNGHVEDEPELIRARAPYLVVRDGDPEWQSLSKRQDKMPAELTP